MNWFRATNGIHSPFTLWSKTRYHHKDMDIAFVKACKLILDVQGDPCSSIDCYIDNTPGLTVDIPCSENASRSEAAISLTIKEVTQPDDANKPIPCEAMVAEDKLLAEGSLSETKVSWDGFSTLEHSSFSSQVTSSLHGWPQFRKWSPWNTPSQKNLTRQSDEWDMWGSWFPGFTISSVDSIPFIIPAQVGAP